MLELPQEILNLISSHCDREDLKALRLANSECNFAASQHLFHTIHISPSSFSFDRALNIALADNLHRHSKSLVYHFGVLGDYYAGFDDFKHEYFQTRKPGESRDPSEVTSEVLWCYSCWLEELDGQRTFELRDEKEELKDLCGKLPYLEEIYTLMDDCEDYVNPKDYIGRRTGMVAAEDTGNRRFARLFRASSEKALKKISARSIQWLDVIKIADDLRVDDARLSRLSYLELGIYNIFEEAEDEDGKAYDHLGALEQVLSMASNIQVLKLDFDELPLESEPESMQPISRTIFQHHWPHLRNLKLEAICADEDLFTDFLISHQSSLRKLQIGDVELTRSRNKKDSGDVLRFFRAIRDNLQLTSAKLTGNFTNRTYQAWYVDTEVQSPHCYREQLQTFLCSALREGHLDETDAVLRWPFICDSPAIPQEDYRISCVYDMECIDSSWYWCPELLETGDFDRFLQDDDWDNEEEIDGFFPEGDDEDYNYPSD